MGHARHIGNGIPRLLVRPSRTIRARLVFAVLLAFALRAVIPVGFMPASDGSLALMICPGGLPAGLFPGRSMPAAGGMPMPAHQHPGHSLMDEGYCAFTTGFSSAPPPLLLLTLFLLLSCVAVIAMTALPTGGIRLVHLPQARAPPAPL
ncbi:MAG TPA: hypothetical protein VGN43_05840 [Steroidobacteraceae bacterium]|jgi:hypothetical protein|nr:hypothetical protein [Steroidobacteraceae bacterium]